MTTRLSLRMRFTNRHLSFLVGRVAATIFLWLMAFGVQGASADTLVVDDLPQLDCPGAPYTSIQAAINAAMPGDTVQVCPGTYVENVFLDKRLKLYGAQQGVDARGRMANESVVTPLVATMRILELRTGSADSIIDGFTFLGGNRGIESTSGPTDRVQLLNNRIRGFTDNGVFLNRDGINMTVDRNDIDGALTKVSAGGVFHLDTDNFDGFWFTNNNVLNGPTGTGFFVDGNRNVDKGTSGARLPAFTGNLIDRHGTGANIGSRAWGDGDITGNTFSNNDFDGLQGGPLNALIGKNLFDSNGRHGLALTSFGNTTDPTRGAQKNRIELNCFTRNGATRAGAGILFSSTQPPGTISTNRANDNNIIRNLTGVQYVGAETVNAELNWWNSATGPTHVANPGGTGDTVIDDGNGVDYDPWRTKPVTGTPCGRGPATTLELEPEAATNPVDTTHCVTATVMNAFGIPQPGVTVQFMITGSVITSGSATTDGDGEAVFCYDGPALPGEDMITAFADTDDSGTPGPGEPVDTATKTWVLPVTTPGCEITITNGGWIIAMNGDRASFGGNAKADGDGNVSGQEQYQDHGPAQPFNLHGTPMVITCGTDETQATIFGEATIDGAGPHTFRIDVRDIGEPGKGVDHYRMQVDEYDSGDQTLRGGNVQIRRQD